MLIHKITFKIKILLGKQVFRKNIQSIQKCNIILLIDVQYDIESCKY